MDSSNKKTIYWIRHGQACHNVAFYEYGEDAYCMEAYRDAHLTEVGKNQAKLTKQTKSELESVEMVLISPLMRTMQTADIIFKNHPNAYALSLIKEIHYEDTCNQSKTKEDLQPLFPHVNYETIDIDVFECKSQKKDLHNCILVLDQMLKQSEHTKIAIVSHHDFIREFMKFKFDKSVHLDNCEVYTIDDYK